jgi:glutamate N-acetyltransferase/amino-acid N-acetyltransferase
MLRIAGGVTAARGFAASGVSCGIKRSGRPDLSIVLSDRPVSASAVFTTNRVPAAPVILGRQRILSNPSDLRGVLTVSGVANALTGSDGIEDNLKILASAESEFELPAGSLLPACTGVIGPRIPVAKVTAALPALKAGLSDQILGGERAAHAILTTDTRSKESAVQVRLSDGTIARVGGMAKGSGMIAPQMALPHATTLVYLTTDANVSPDGLRDILGAEAEDTFNMVCVDGDTSTNDTVYLLANGAAGGVVADHDPDLRAAIRTVMESLARQVARDGEGATKLLTVTVSGARTMPEARLAARSVVGSTLVKAALFGSDPNVGRIAAALGYSGARMDPDRLDVVIAKAGRAEVPLIIKGRPAPGLENGGARRIRELLQRLDEVPVEVRLHAGKASATAWGCDLSYAYVQINAAYHT